MADEFAALPTLPVFLSQGFPEVLRVSLRNRGLPAGAAIVVFSSDALADAFRDAERGAALGHISVPTDNPFVLRRIFKTQHSNGATHVLVDPTAHQHESGQVHPLGPIIDALDRWLDGTGGAG